MAIKTDDLDAILAGKTTDDLDSILLAYSSPVNDLAVLMRGGEAVLDDLDAILAGKTTDDLDSILAGKTTEDLDIKFSAEDPVDVSTVYDFIESEIKDFEITSGDLINIITINFDYNFATGKYRSAITKENPLSKLIYREAKKTLSFKMITSSRLAEILADAILKVSSVPELLVSFTHNIKSIYVVPGDEVSLTHRAGLKAGGYIKAPGTVYKKGLRGPEIPYTLIMKASGYLYQARLVALSLVATGGAPGVTVEYAAGVATITIYADVEGYPPIEGAEVSIGGIKHITDSSGQARFNLEVGRYTAIITASGYEDGEFTFTV
jgi:hypothetical protein